MSSPGDSRVASRTVSASDLEQADGKRLSGSSTPVLEKPVAPVPDGPPNGGYGWVVTACQFFINFCTWGYVTVFGVFLSFYRKTNFFPGATDIQFAFIGGLGVSIAFLVSPLSNYLSKTYGFKVPMCAGILIYTLAQIFAGLSRTIWELFLTQGVMFGIGVGLVFMPTLPLLAQWFTTKRGVATGIASGGAGVGSLVISFVTRAAIENISLKWAFIINALIGFVLLVPSVLLMKNRVAATGAKFEPLQLRFFTHKGFIFVLLWAWFSLFGYVIAVYTLATYGTAGVGLTQTQGANLQAIQAAFQAIGRPIIGIFLDKFGKINGTSGATFIAGLSCFVIWIFSKNYGLLVFFAIVQGFTGGTYFSACGPVTAEVVGLRDMGSAMAILWITGVLPSLFAEPIGFGLIDYSQTKLGWSGPHAYEICIVFAGGSFVLASIFLMGAKKHTQGSWNPFTKA